MSGTISAALSVLAEKNPDSAIARLYTPPPITERTFHYDFRSSGYRHYKYFSAEEHEALFIAVSKAYCEKHGIADNQYNGPIFYYSGIRDDVFYLGLELTKLEGKDVLRQQRPKGIVKVKKSVAKTKPRYTVNPL
jgi:hypothetical protein